MSHLRAAAQAGRHKNPTTPGPTCVEEWAQLSPAKQAALLEERALVREATAFLRAGGSITLRDWASLDGGERAALVTAAEHRRPQGAKEPAPSQLTEAPA